MKFPKHPTARILQGKPVFLFPFNHGSGIHSLFGFDQEGGIYNVLPDGTADPILMMTLLQLPCGQVFPVHNVVACIKAKVSRN